MKFLPLFTIFLAFLLIGLQSVSADRALHQLKKEITNLERDGDIPKIAKRGVEILKTLGEASVPLIGEIESCVEIFERAKKIIENHN